MFAVDILPCLCLAALCSSAGKGAKAGVAGPAGAAFAGPTFWPSMLPPCSFISFRFFFFELTSDFI